MTSLNQLGFKGIVIATAQNAVNYVVRAMTVAPGNVARAAVGVIGDAFFGHDRQTGAGGGWMPKAHSDFGSVVMVGSALSSANFYSGAGSQTHFQE